MKKVESMKSNKSSIPRRYRVLSKASTLIAVEDDEDREGGAEEEESDEGDVVHQTPFR